jgi:hypothetical protein
VNPGGSTLSNGNLDCVTTYGNSGRVVGSIAVSSGKWYWEVVKTGGSAGQLVGIAPASDFTLDEPGKTSNSFAYYTDGGKYSNSTLSSYGSSWTTGDVIGVALDLDAGTIVFYKNNASQGTAFSGLSGNFVAAISDDTGGGSTNFSINFGQRPFAYPLSGFKALCTTNLPEPTIADGSTVMDVALYTGNGSTQTISGLNFSPDLVWCKVRGNGVAQHVIYDSVRDAYKRLTPNGTTAETDVNPYGVTAFSSTGFTVADTFNGNYEINGDPSGTYGTGGYVAWTWDAGGTTDPSNQAGSITSQVRANVSAGFSVVTYTGNATGGATVGHGLGVAPAMFIVKSRSLSESWPVYHASLGATKLLRLEGTGAEETISTAWNNTAPTSTVFSLGSPSGFTNSSGATYVAYCFAPVAGYSSFGSYVGNGSSDGVFVYTGFRSRWILIKVSAGDTGNWWMYDSARSSYNLADLGLYANSSIAEFTSNGLDMLSNGFKIRTANGNTNGSGYTFVWAAFAENPFQYARAR